MCHKNYFFAPLVLLFLLTACVDMSRSKGIQETGEVDKMTPLYAKGFRVINENGERILQIMNPWNQEQVLQELNIFSNSIFFKQFQMEVPKPVNRVVALSSTQWSAFERMNGLGVVVGISESNFVRSEAMRNYIREGLTIDVGKHGSYKPELLIQLEPEMVIYSPESGGAVASLTETGLPLLAWPDYFETDPLGRAEWIKLAGILLDKEQEAYAIFDSIEDSYNNYRSLASQVKHKPLIFADKSFSGQWYVPGGKSYMAKLFEHAGATYIWSDNTSTASFSVDMESVISRAWEADFWRIAHAAPYGYSKAELINENPIYAQFKAFKKDRIIFCNTASTGYFEKGPYEPHLILADLIHFLHPELLTDYQPKYHQLLD